LTTSMKHQTVKSPLHPVSMFNGYIGAQVAFCYQQIGLFSVLTPGKAVPLTELAARTGSEIGRLRALLRVGELLGYFVQEDNSYLVTEMGEELRSLLGYFTWSVGGYGNMLQQLANLTTSQKTWGHLRNDGLVALGADMCNRSFMAELLYGVLDQLEFSKIADLGCGNAGRLIQLCQRYPHITGVGIDISQDAIALAEANVKANRLEGRLQLVCANVLDTLQEDNEKKELEDVEIISSFMMFHDLYNIPHLRDQIFDKLRKACPNVRYFLIADTVRNCDLDMCAQLPIFSLGYELVHAFMDVYIPTKEEYEQAFDRAGLKLKRCIHYGTPSTYLFLLET
jgi:SAM-dependent methyltransferase